MLTLLRSRSLRLIDVFLGAIAVCSLASARNAMQVDGQAVPCGPSILFARLSRFSDFDLMVPVTQAADPYSLGFLYPPSAILLFRAISETPHQLADWIGLRFVNDHITSWSNAADAAVCPPRQQSLVRTPR